MQDMCDFCAGTQIKSRKNFSQRRTIYRWYKLKLYFLFKKKYVNDKKLLSGKETWKRADLGPSIVYHLHRPSTIVLCQTWKRADLGF